MLLSKMAHNTFGDTEAESSASYVASAKRQRKIRRCIKLFFRIMAALAIVVLAAMVVVLAVTLDRCKQSETPVIEIAYVPQGSNDTVAVCDGITAGPWCLRKHFTPDTWDRANLQCNNLKQKLPTDALCKKFPWLSNYLLDTWSSKSNSVFTPSCGQQEVKLPMQSKTYFCVSHI